MMTIRAGRVVGDVRSRVPLDLGGSLLGQFPLVKQDAQVVSVPW